MVSPIKRNMGGSRSILGNHTSLGFLLFSVLFIALAAALVIIPMSSDDSDAGDIFSVGDYKYETLSNGSNEVKISTNNMYLADVVIYNNVYYEGKTYYVKEIADDGFREMTSLKTVNIRVGIEKIGDYAFLGCISLNNVSLPESLTTINRFAFSGCVSLNNVSLPKSLTTINKGAFSGCESLESIRIRENVSLIDTEVFFGCTKLSSISVDIQSDHYAAVDNVLYNKARTALHTYPLGKSNETFAMPNTVITLDQYSMYHSKVKNIILSNNLTSIGDSALEGSNIVSISLPSTVASIGYRALSNCNNLKTITVDRDNNHYSALDGVLFNSLQTDLMVYPSGIEDQTYMVPDTVKNIREFAFMNNSHLTEVYLTDGASTIGRYSFSGCTALKRVEMPDSIATVGEYAYSGCTSLRSVILSKTMTTLDVGVFMNCSSIEVFYIPQNITVLKENSFTGCTAINSLYVPSTMEHIYDAFGGFTFYDRNQITVVSETMISGTYRGNINKMYQEIGTYSMIHYDEDHGSVMLDDEMRKHNEQYIFPTYSGVREGFNFIGWEYNDSVYLPGDIITTPTANSVMTAVWEEIVEEDDSNKITLEVAIAIIVTGAGIVAAAALGYYYHKRVGIKTALKDDDDTIWRN